MYGIDRSTTRPLEARPENLSLDNVSLKARSVSSKRRLRGSSEAKSAGRAWPKNTKYTTAYTRTIALVSKESRSFAAPAASLRQETTLVPSSASNALSNRELCRKPSAALTLQTSAPPYEHRVCVNVCKCVRAYMCARICELTSCGTPRSRLLNIADTYALESDVHRAPMRSTASTMPSTASSRRAWKDSPVHTDGMSFQIYRCMMCSCTCL